MVRFFLKVIILIVVISAAYLSVNFFFTESFAANQLRNTFVPSSENINNLQTSSNLDELTKSAPVFDEYTEGTIDRQGFYIRIDKIGLFKRVIKDVDPRYKDVYVKSWEYGVSHGKFTSYPDQIGITYLFSHATSDKADAISQNAWFSYLDMLSQNDIIYIYYQGNKYTYEVSEIKAVSPDATGFYTGASPVAKLRMQYCGPPTGSLSARTLVDAILIDKEAI